MGKMVRMVCAEVKSSLGKGSFFDRRSRDFVSWFGGEGWKDAILATVSFTGTAGGLINLLFLSHWLATGEMAWASGEGQGAASVFLTLLWMFASIFVLPLWFHTARRLWHDIRT